MPDYVSRERTNWREIGEAQANWSALLMLNLVTVILPYDRIRINRQIQLEQLHGMTTQVNNYSIDHWTAVWTKDPCYPLIQHWCHSDNLLSLLLLIGWWMDSSIRKHTVIIAGDFSLSRLSLRPENCGNFSHFKSILQLLVPLGHLQNHHQGPAMLNCSV